MRHTDRDGDVGPLGALICVALALVILLIV
jgi:hypothetical protein